VVALQAPHPAAGLLAVYDTRPADQVLAAHFAGFARPASAGGGRGVRLAFAPGFAQGALLSVQLPGRGEVVNVPMYLSSK
jgi:hypothetical protein